MILQFQLRQRSYRREICQSFLIGSSLFFVQI